MSESFEQLRRLVDFNVGVIAVGFAKTDDAERETTRANSDDPDSTQARIAQSMTDKSSCLSRFLELLIPPSLKKAAISEYLSTLLYEHSEVALFLNAAGMTEFGKDKMLAIGCDLANGVYLRPRGYHHLYSWAYVICDSEATLAVLQFAVQQRGRPFASGQMTRIATTPGPDDRRSYFCAKLTMACLEHLPLPDFHMNPVNKLTNDLIYELVSRKQNSTTKPTRIVPAQFGQLFQGLTEPTPVRMPDKRI
jgi:hypothetical protein